MLREAPRLFSHHHPTSTSRISSGRPHDVPNFPTLSQTLPDCHPFPAAPQLATLRIFDPLSLVRFPPPTVSRLRTHYCSALAAPVSNFVLWPVWPTKRTIVWLHVRMSTEDSSNPAGNIRHKLSFFVLQERHALLVLNSEVVFELETELLPSSRVVVVIRSRVCSKLQNFCHV